jgi:PncC family amidohydrolase
MYTGSVVAYADEAKTALLGVDPGLLAAHGAVSAEVAAAMAEGALQLPGATVAVATTGVAGPTGGSVERPTGTVWFALAATGAATRTEVHRYGGDRGMVRQRARTTALDLLRRALLES